MLAVRSIGKSFLDVLSDVESDIRHGLSDFESDARHGLSDFESKNREWIQATIEGTACVVGATYLGPAGGKLVCLPFAQRLTGLGGRGELVNPNDPNDPRAAAARAYESGDPGWAALIPKSSEGRGLALLLLLALAGAMVL